MFITITGHSRFDVSNFSVYVALLVDLALLTQFYMNEVKVTTYKVVESIGE